MFGGFLGVVPSSLTPGSLPDNRRDIVILDDESFRWGPWSGPVSGAGRDFEMSVRWPSALRRRFDFNNASIGLLLGHDTLRVWLPDLGIDRDIDQGHAGEDLDAPDMRFRRTRS